MRIRLSFLRSGRAAAFAALSSAALTVSAVAAPINVVNPGFEQTLTPNSSAFGDIYPTQQVTGWTTNGYNFVFRSGTADTTGAAGPYGDGNVQLWGPGNGAPNGLPASSPDGGNFLALDGAFTQGPVSQTLSGLTPGAATTVSFYFAGAQQYSFSGPTTEQLQVSLGTQSLFTPVLQNANHGFTGWQLENLTFTPTAASETLSFFAIGTPQGVPPFSLVDGVSVNSQGPSPVPEPSSLALLATGFAGVSGVIRARWKKNNR